MERTGRQRCAVARRDAALSEGRVQVLDAGVSYRTQGWFALQELRRLADLDSGWDWARAAVIGREWKVLEPVRSGCELLNIPCHFAGQRKNAPPARRLRAVARLLRLLHERRGELMPLEQLRAQVAALRGDEADSPGNRLVMEFLDDLGSAVGDEALPLALALDAAYEFLAEAARVAAICVRRLQDVTAEWRSQLAVDAWEVVLPELVIEPES